METTATSKKAMVQTIDNGSSFVFIVPREQLIEPVKPVEKANPEEIEFTPKQAAEYCDCCVQTLINWRKQNIIKAYGIGRRIKFRKSELDAAKNRRNISLK